MQQIIVDIIVVLAAIFIARMVYRSVAASRKAKQQAACSGCGTCEHSQKAAGPAAAPQNFAK